MSFVQGRQLNSCKPIFLKSEEFLANAVKEDPQAVRQGLDVISDDLAKLAKRLITEGGVTGIYFSLQSLLGISPETYKEVLEPGEKEILAAANSVSDYNILHICGYAGHHNDLTLYKDYNVKTINWAVVVEGVSIPEGRKIFGNRAALGGFGNLDSELLYKARKKKSKLKLNAFWPKLDGRVLFSAQIAPYRAILIGSILNGSAKRQSKSF